MSWISLDVMYESAPQQDYLNLAAILPVGGKVVSYEFQNNPLVAPHPTMSFNFDSYETSSFPGKPVVTKMSDSEKSDVRKALDYISSVTGISFNETNDPNGDLNFVSDSCLTNSTSTNYGNAGVQALTWQKVSTDRAYKQGMIQLDKSENASYFDPGNQGYERLLGEIGYALGLNHPTYSPSGNTWTTQQTVMAYQHGGSGYATAYTGYDLAALNWLYGGDGIGGIAQGVNLTSIWTNPAPPPPKTPLQITPQNAWVWQGIFNIWASGANGGVSASSADPMRSNQTSGSLAYSGG